MQPSVLELAYQFSGRRLFYVLKRDALRTVPAEIRDWHGTVFRGGRKPFPKPSAFESEIHPTHKPSVYAPGYFALAGSKFAQAQIYSPKEPDCIYPCRPKGRGAWMLLLQTATFFGGYAAIFMGLRKSPCLRLPEIDSREPPGYGQRFAVSRPMAVAHKENGGIRISAKGKEKGIREKKFIYRNGETA